MDSVRFGRALGSGARHAARALVDAADAASSPNPSGRPAPSQAAAPPPASTPQSDATQQRARQVARAAAETKRQVAETSQGVRRGGRRFGEAVWNPFVRLSGVLWLEITGVFFGLFAVSAALNAWRLRDALHATAASQTQHRALLFSLVVVVVFGYFCVSSFVRARRRERNR